MDVTKRKVSRMVECTNIKANVAKCGYICNGTGPPGVHSTLSSGSPGPLISSSMPPSCPVFSTDNFPSDQQLLLSRTFSCLLTFLPRVNSSFDNWNFFKIYYKICYKLYYPSSVLRVAVIRRATVSILLSKLDVWFPRFLIHGFKSIKLFKTRLTIFIHGWTKSQRVRSLKSTDGDWMQIDLSVVR